MPPNTARDSQRVARSIGAITADFVRKREAKVVNNQDRGAERVEQIQVEVTGAAGNVVAWTPPITVLFDTLFYVTTGNTQGMLGRPHVSVGIEQTSGNPVMLVANVVGWRLTDDADVEGCQVRFGVASPGATVATPYTALVHLTFQSYGTPYGDAEGDTNS